MLNLLKMRINEGFWELIGKNIIRTPFSPLNFFIVKKIIVFI